MKFPIPFAQLLLLVISLVLARPGVSAAADNLSEKLVGTWAETGGKDSLVTIEKDGTFKLYLKKGEIEDKHFLDGTWTVTPEAKFTVSLKIGAEPDTFSAQLKFEGEQMILVDEDGKETRHNRHKGPIPERFNW